MKLYRKAKKIKQTNFPELPHINHSLMSSKATFLTLAKL